MRSVLMRAGVGRKLPRGTRRGSVLIVVVWTVILLSVLVAGMGAQGLFALGVTERMEQRLQASYIAQAGVQHALQVLAADPTASVDGLNDGWAADESSASRPLGAGSFTMRLVDEERALNLNTLPADILLTLLLDVGQVPDDDARRLVDAIEDWRDPDDDARPEGAENFYYLGLSNAYEAKNGPFEHLDELLLVRGMTPAISARLVPLLTVHGSGDVNINTAGREVLRILGLSDSGVSSILVDRAGPDGREGTEDDHVITSVSAIEGELAPVVSVEDRQRLVELVQQHVLAVRSEAFHIRVTATVPGSRAPVHVRCIATRAGTIQAWAEE